MGATTTALDLISASMKLINALAAGETLRAEDSADALDRLNDLLEAWRLERLLVYNVSRLTFPLVAGTQLYTIGTGGTFNTDRPVWIDSAKLEFNHGTVNQFELPLTMFTDQQWAEVSMKAMASSFPTGVWFNQSYPLAELRFWPIPSQADLYVALMLPQIIISPVSLTTVMALPPGYQKALRYNLAVELAPEFGVPLDPMVYKLAKDTKAAIANQNDSPVELRLDPALTPTRSPWNYFTGGFGGRW